MQWNDTDVAHYNFDVDEPILITIVKMLLTEYANGDLLSHLS